MSEKYPCPHGTKDGALVICTASSDLRIVDMPRPGDWYVGEFVPKIAEACAAAGCKLVNSGQVEGFVSKGDGSAVAGALSRWEVRAI